MIRHVFITSAEKDLPSGTKAPGQRIGLSRSGCREFRWHRGFSNAASGEFCLRNVFRRSSEQFSGRQSAVLPSLQENGGGRQERSREFSERLFTDSIRSVACGWGRAVVPLGRPFRSRRTGASGPDSGLWFARNPACMRAIMPPACPPTSGKKRGRLLQEGRCLRCAGSAG